MKTYKTTIEKPCLEIRHDTMADNPRTFDVHLGHFITCERDYKSPDDNEELQNLIQNTSEESKDVEEHMEKIKAEMEKDD